jgi:succinyl-CoA synthetase alpha subunit
MSILIDGETKVICQGITGSFGAFHTEGCLNYGTKVVGGVTPGKGGQTGPGNLPIYDTVADAVDDTGANATMIFVPRAFAADAALEAAAAGITVICTITEGIPTQDMIRVKAALKDYHGAIIGGKDDTAQAKIKALEGYGVHVAESPAEIGSTMAAALGLN